MLEVKNNRVYLDGKPTNEYVCDICGDRVSSLRSEDVYGEEKQICSECETDIDHCDAEEMYLAFYNNYLTVAKMAEDYNMNENLLRVIINEGRTRNHTMVSPEACI
jgi:hypothetical protein